MFQQDISSCNNYLLFANLWRLCVLGCVNSARDTQDKSFKFLSFYVVRGRNVISKLLKDKKKNKKTPPPNNTKLTRSISSCVIFEELSLHDIISDIQPILGTLRALGVRPRNWFPARTAGTGVLAVVAILERIAGYPNSIVNLSPFSNNPSNIPLPL